MIDGLPDIWGTLQTICVESEDVSRVLSGFLVLVRFDVFWVLVRFDPVYVEFNSEAWFFWQMQRALPNV